MVFASVGVPAMDMDGGEEDPTEVGVIPGEATRSKRRQPGAVKGQGAEGPAAGVVNSNSAS